MDINIRFSADDRLLNSLDYLSGWMCALYKLVKQQEPKRLFPPAGLPTLEPEERAKLDEMVGKVLDDAKEKPAVASSASPAAIPKTNARTSSEPAKNEAPAKPAEEAPAESAKKAEKERRAEVKRIAGNAARNGKSDEVKELIARYGVHKLSDIPIDKLDAFAEEVSKL